MHTIYCHSNVQEWSKCGDENALTLRQTARKCLGVLPFTATSDVCVACTGQKIHTISRDEKVPEDIDSVFNKFFPGASNLMLTFLKQQSEMCSSCKDKRCRRWDKNIIQVHLS